MKKMIILYVLLLFIAVIAFSQTSLDTALRDSTIYLNGRIPVKSKVVVLNFTSDWNKLSDYIIEELIGYIVNDGNLTVVDRANLETIRREMNFQLSGEVSDETAQSIGKKLGAQTIISGAITAIGSMYRLRIRAISVETAQILGMQNIDVAQDSRLAALTGTAYAGPSGTRPVSAPQPASAVMPSVAGWESNYDKNSSVNVSAGREYIDGQDRDILILETRLSSGEIKWAGALLKDELSVRKLKEGSGFRFKALGDGKQWRVYIAAEDTLQYETIIKTKNGKVVDVDIPFSKLKQVAWNRKVAFNKNNIKNLAIERYSPLGAGASTIKIFDFEIY